MRLLIVEDEEQLARNLKKILEARGFAVDYLTAAEKAKTRILLYRKEYALIVLDLGLPDMDGAELTKVVRAEGITTPIIILTGRSDTETKIALLNAGADDYVVKPFESGELIARINSVLRRPAIAQSPVRKVGRLTVDSSARRVRLDDEDIPFTLKEYSLFECLLQKPNDVVTRDELASSVWDFESVSWSNVLDVHMKNLRKKLRSAAADMQLETIRGVGYRLSLTV